MAQAGLTPDEQDNGQDAGEEGPHAAKARKPRSPRRKAADLANDPTDGFGRAIAASEQEKAERAAFAAKVSHRKATARPGGTRTSPPSTWTTGPGSGLNARGRGSWQPQAPSGKAVRLDAQPEQGWIAVERLTGGGEGQLGQSQDGAPTPAHQPDNPTARQPDSDRVLYGAPGE